MAIFDTHTHIFKGLVQKLMQLFMAFDRHLASLIFARGR